MLTSDNHELEILGAENAVGSCKYPLRPEDGPAARVLIAAQARPPLIAYLPWISASDSFNTTDDPLSNSTSQWLMLESISTRCRCTQSNHGQKNKGEKSA
jgi:hypothetical protein